MVWTRIVGGLVFLVVVSYVVQWFLPKQPRARRMNPRQFARWDIAPLLGFFGVLLLLLSGVQAAQQADLSAWLWGIGAGALIGVFGWIALAQTARSTTTRAQPSMLRIALWLVRTYGLFFLIAFLALNLAVRWLGAALELFMAGGLGAIILIGALALFSTARKATDNSPQR